MTGRKTFLYKPQSLSLFTPISIYLKWANNTQLRINFFGIGRLNVARVHSFRWVDIIFFLTNYKLTSTITWENILILFNYSHSLYTLLYLYLCKQTLNFVVFPFFALLWVNTRDLMAVAPLKLFTQLRFLHLMALIIWQRWGRRWASFRPFDQQAMPFEFSRSLLLCLFSSFAVLLLSSSSPLLPEQLNYCYYPFRRSVDSGEQASRWILSFIPPILIRFPSSSLGSRSSNNYAIVNIARSFCLFTLRVVNVVSRRLLGLFSARHQLEY